MAELETTFIPKKPLVAETPAPGAPKAGRGLFNLIGVVIFIAALVAATVAYFAKVTFERQVTLMSRQLEIARGAFEPSLIAEMQRLDKKLQAATAVLRDHLSLSPLFVELEKSTLKQVQFTDFNYAFEANAVEIKMAGKANDYKTIALQNDLLALNKYLKNILFSNMVLDEAGRVKFDLTFNIDPAFLKIAG
ncbi:MAG TPA: hypothetical protein VJ103_01855 [Candidatus Paceibacterota bacterium]|nr:hypothetical protein [Candidatus Paceibacterota bacterium]